MDDDTFPQLGTSSSLSPWAGPYVTQMLGKGAALANMPYEAYQGPLTAGESNLQTQAFSGLANLTLPTSTQTSYTPQSFITPGVASSYMSPYLEASLNPQIAAAKRQAEIQAQALQGQYAKSGAYGGGRQAVAEAELQRGLLDRLSGITGQGYQTAYEQAQNQFNTEQARQMAAANQAQQYGLQALGAQAGAGATQRDIAQQGVAADIAQFETERDYPYKQVQYMQSLLQGLPISTQSYQYAAPSVLGGAAAGAGDILSLLKAIGIG